MKPLQVWKEGGGSEVKVKQRIVPYPNQIPRGAGITDQKYRDTKTPGHYQGYMFRRNFTFGLASPANANDGAAWTLEGAPPTDWQFKNFRGGNAQGDMTAIACAINTFDQSEVYRWQYNGYCYNGNSYNTPGWGTINRYSSCIIDFGPPAGGGSVAGSTAGSDTGSQKRAIGEFNGWQVYGMFPYVSHEALCADKLSQASRCLMTMRMTWSCRTITYQAIRLSPWKR
jgi:hypothetical protein